MFARVIAFAALLVCGAAFGESTASFTLPSGVAIRIVEANFDAGQFKIDGCTQRAGFCRINGQFPFGFDGWPLPKTYVKEIEVKHQGVTYSLDSSHMYNAWGSRPLEVKGVVRYFGGKCNDSRNCAFRGLFSDAAGAFVAEWRIVDGRAFRTVITYSNDVTSLFIKNIDPPEYE
jgi:hypothetical protein